MAMESPRSYGCARAPLRPFPFLTALLFFALLLRPAAEARQDDDDVVKVETDLVVLNVTVTDRKGGFVRKLKKSDFVVFEDGREQIITSFSVEETAFAAAVLLDTSGSMETRLTLARAAAIRFLDGLREQDSAAVYHFHSKVEQLQDFSPGRDLPPMAFGLNPKGYTALHDAVQRAAKDLSARPEKRRAIVVLSDGMDNSSSTTREKALAAALDAQATIYTVDMMDPRAASHHKLSSAAALKDYAQKTGGRYVATPGGAELGEAFEGIVEELRNQYTIGYSPTNRARDGKWRSIKLKLSDEKLNARTRSGYRAPKR